MLHTEKKKDAENMPGGGAVTTTLPGNQTPLAGPGVEATTI